MQRVDGDVWLEFFEALGGNLDLGSTDIACAEEDLAVNVGNVDGVVIDDRDGSNACGSQRLHDWAAETACADD